MKSIAEIRQKHVLILTSVVNSNIGVLGAEPLGEGVMEASARSFDFAQDDTAEAAIRGILPPFVY